MIFIHLFVFGKYSAIFSSSCQVTNLEFDSHLTALSRDLFIFSLLPLRMMGGRLHCICNLCVRYSCKSFRCGAENIIMNIRNGLSLKIIQHQQHLKPLNTENRCGPAASSTLPSFNHPIITFLYPGSSSVSSFVHLLTHLRTG